MQSQARNVGILRNLKSGKKTNRWLFVGSLVPLPWTSITKNEEYKVDQEGVVLKFSSSALKGIMMPLFSRQDTHQLLGRHPNRVVALYLGWFWNSDNLEVGKYKWKWPTPLQIAITYTSGNLFGVDETDSCSIWQRDTSQPFPQSSNFRKMPIRLFELASRTSTTLA